MALPAVATDERSRASGAGMLRVARIAGKSRVVEVESRAPLKILCPKNHGTAPWAYTTSFGGGLVDGDTIDLRVRVDTEAAALVTTQSATKVYRSARGASQGLRASVGGAALLALIPDPVAAFAGARYRQSTRIDLADGASLVALEAFTCGRRAYGERWSLASCASRLVVARNGAPVLVDALLLDADHGAIDARMQRFDAIATLVAIGQRTSAVQRAILASSAPLGPVVVAASPLRDGAIARIAAETVEALAVRVRALLTPLVESLGDDPFARKW